MASSASTCIVVLHRVVCTHAFALANPCRRQFGLWPAYRLIRFDRIRDGVEFALLGGAFWATLQCISPLHQQSMQRVCYRWSWSRTVGWMRPVAGGERKSELLKLPDGCN